MHFNGDFILKNILLALGFEPTTFQLMSSCMGICFFFSSLIDHLAPFASKNFGDHKPVTNITKILAGIGSAGLLATLLEAHALDQLVVG